MNASLSLMVTAILFYKKIYFNINNTVSTYINTLTFFSFALPDTRLTIVHEITPIAMPSEMLYASGIAIMQRNAGIASVISLKSIFTTEPIM